ncbi:LuxR C-terminal-related transcriptional regulator [Microbacterium allomyrinae]|uniref:LuxR family transcriptional regulator n=1 Tax=Microbacterium allomyrinae TaxID=2830666 RepID=A0A9X1S3I4_9MICO|nr:LuxR C-terminal-related transcriptional regulator [Microbacterium allomyrinae]MCC2032547.1 LuxR family transcriptional regulator [Microbacterium allomyrinae]
MDRPALRERLDAGLAAPLSLVVAPAGAGKSVLLAQWARTVEDRVVVWLDVAATDEDALVFSRRLVSAITEAAPDFARPAAPVAASDRRLGDAFVEEIAGGLSQAGPLLLIFDDVDRLGGTEVLADLWRLVGLLPATTHAVFASRIDLQLGWSRHRLQHALVELRQRELAFDDETTTLVLESIIGRPVDHADATAITARTEGWAVGVQLTALSLRFAAEPDRIVDTLADTDRLVVDYLSEEVLDGIDPLRREALTRLSIVDEMCAGLVEAVCGIEGAAFLADLERDSLFVVPVPGNPGWFRFHRLFHDLLLLRLRAGSAARSESELLQSAAEWFDREGLVDSAIDCLVRARQWTAVLDRVLRLGRERYEERRMARVAGWLAQVPAEVRAARPDAELLFAIAQGMTGRTTPAVAAFREMLAAGVLDEGQTQVAAAYLAACVQFEPHPELFAGAADQALAALGQHPDATPPDLVGVTSRPLLTMVADGSRGRALFLLGDLEGAQRALRAALAGAGSGYRPYRVHGLGSLALAEAFAGRLRAATEHADEALATATASELLSHPAPADAYLARAVVAVQRGEPDAGALALAEGTLRAASNRRTQLLWVSRLIAALVEPDDLDPDADAGSLGAPPPLVRQGLLAQAMRRARLQGSPSLSVPHAQGWSIAVFEAVAALLTAGRTEAARAVLAQHPFDPDPARVLRAVEHEILLGWASATEGRPAPVREHLLAALDLAEPEWLVHPFVRAGPRVAELIDDLPGVGSEFRTIAVNRARRAGASREQELVDALTPRELELLAYLPSRLTIADIAARNFVSTNTVKTHLGHIYRKMGVRGRDAAIQRARELGLVDAAEIARVG